MKDKRSRYEVMVAILEIVINEATITRIVYGANINFKMAQAYIEYLIEKGLITMFSRNGKNLYKITDKGTSFLKKFLELRDLE